MRILVRVIDSISEWSGKTMCWLCMAIILVLVYQVIMRYVFRLSTIWTYDTVCLLGGSSAVLAWAYVHRHNGHVRVDVLYNLLPPRGRAIIDVAGGLIFFLPMFVVLAFAAADRLQYSYVMGAKLWQSAYFCPPDWPYRLVVLVGVSLFLLQGVARVTHDLYFLVRNKSL